MVRIIITVLVYMISIIAHAQSSNNSILSANEENTLKIDVVINKIQSNKGTVYFALYDSMDNFNNRKPLKTVNCLVKDGMVKVQFDNIKPGIYAVTCFHDANDNGKMDFEPSGIPLEDYGTSNNIMSFGPPRFNDCKFVLSDKDLTFEIKL